MLRAGSRPTRSTRSRPSGMTDPTAPAPDRAHVLRRKITSRLKDARRHLRALRDAQAEFGEDFDLAQFELAFRSEDPTALNKVAAVERNLDRLYNYIVEVTAFGIELAGERRADETPNAPRDLRRLQCAGGITVSLRDRLLRLSELRRMMVHDYTDAAAAEVHEATRILTEALPPFVKSFAAWVRPHLADSGPTPR